MVQLMVRLLISLVLTAMAYSPAIAKPVESQISELSSADRSELNARIGWARTLVKNHYKLSLTFTKSSDLGVLQRVIDEKIVSPKNTVQQQSLGLALGNILVARLGYHWVIVQDVFGRDLAIRFRQSTKLGFPLTAISKRVEQGKPVDLQAAYRFYAQARSIHSD